MPELPDLTVYLESLESRIANRRLERVRVLNPFLLRTAVPPIAAAEGRKVAGLFEFDSGTLVLTEAGTKRRASLHLVEGEAALNAMDPGGLEVLELPLDDFSCQLKKENHTLKARSPIPVFSPASAMPTPTRSCTVRSSRRSR